MTPQCGTVCFYVEKVSSVPVEKPKTTDNYSWSAAAALSYYRRNRSKAEDIYPSERMFLAETLHDATSVLDIGCAAGGFSRALREIKPDLSYTGVDITPAMIEAACSQFPDDDFQVINGYHLPFPDSSFDVAICYGVLHMTMDWRELLAEGWRVCRNAFLFDLRLTESEGVSDSKTSYQKLAFGGEWDGASAAPYIILNNNVALSALRLLTPVFSSLQAHGYFNPVSGNTVSPYRDVCMSAFCLQKTGENKGITRWELPFQQS